MTRRLRQMAEMLVLMAAMAAIIGTSAMLGVMLGAITVVLMAGP